MNKIQWNRVTWYSKTLAMIFFVALPFLGFYLGMQYSRASAPFATTPSLTSLGASSNHVATSGTLDYYQNPATWQIDANNTAGGFTIAYPIDFDAQDNNTPTPMMNWRLGAIAPGILYFTLTVPRAFEPQTNFSGATLTVGASGNNVAIAQCMNADASGGPATATSTVVINGITFTLFNSSDAGAGNYYETKSYRALHAGKCYAVEYTVHSNQIANYPASYNLQPLDQTKIDDLMQTIIGTFTFQ